jgi:hypothetical protein
MREWIRTPKARGLLLSALSAITILAVALFVVPGLIGSRADILTIAESPSATPASSPSTQLRPTPTPSATPTPDTAPAPVEPAPAQPAAPQQPTAPQQPAIEPGVIGMAPGAYNGCGEYPSGQTVYLAFGWTARQSNTVDIYYALTDADVQASGGFTSLGTGLPETGSVQIPRTCPNGAGVLPYITVKVVANSPTGGSATAYYWGL